MAVKIIRGEDVTLALTIRLPDGDPFDLTGVDEIKVEMQSETGCLEKLYTLGQVTIQNATLGKILIALSDTETSSLVVGSGQPVQAVITKGTITRIAQFLRQLNVQDPPIIC